jgi:hypothetical protein
MVVSVHLFVTLPENGKIIFKPKIATKLGTTAAWSIHTYVSLF